MPNTLGRAAHLIVVPNKPFQGLRSVNPVIITVSTGWKNPKSRFREAKNPLETRVSEFFKSNSACLGIRQERAL